MLQNHVASRFGDEDTTNQLELMLVATKLRKLKKAHVESWES